MRTPKVFSTTTISPHPIKVLPTYRSIFSPAERFIAIRLPGSSSRIWRTVRMRRSNSASMSTGTSAKPAISSMGVIFQLLLRSDQTGCFLGHVTHRRDHFGVRLVGALQHDQLGEL